MKKTAAYTTDRELLFNYITNFDFEIPVETSDAQESISPDSQEPAPEELAEVEKNLGIGSPLDFKSDETYSFGEWLQLSQLKPIDRTISSDRSRKKPKNNLDLINDFIAKRPRIKPAEDDNYDDLALESSTENEQLMTETLAHVYLEQKKYEKAIAAFTVLSLKYPEKSSFFADRIEAVKKLQKN